MRLIHPALVMPFCLGAAAGALAAADDPSEAIAELKTQLQQAPKDQAARRRLAELYLDALLPRAAEQELQRLADAGTDPSLLLVPMARALLAQQKFAAARDWLREAGTDGDPERLALEGEALARLGDRAAAEQRFEAALALDAAQVRALLGRARLAHEAGDEDGARTQAEAALAAAPRSWEAWEMIGRIDARAGRWDDAERAFSRAIAAAPTDWPLQYQRALVRLEQHDFAGAEADLKLIAAALPAHPLAGLLKGRLLLARGDLPAAQDALRTLVQQFPDHTESVLLLAEALQRDQRWGLAKGYLEPLTQRPDAPPLARLMLARSHLGLEEYDQAEALLLGLGDDPEVKMLLAQVYQGQGLEGRAEAVRGEVERSRAVTRARALLAEGRADEARALLEPLLGATPPPREPAILLVRGLAMTGEVTRALALAEQLQDAYPDDAQVLFTLASVVSLTDERPRAKQLYEQAAERDRTAAAPLAGLSLLAMQSGDAEAARAYAGQALELEPDNAAVNQLVASLGGTGAELEAAEAELRQAVAATPDALEQRIALARLLIEAKRPAEALELLDAAPPRQASAPELLLWRGMAQLHDNRPRDVLATIARIPAEQAGSLKVRWLSARAHALTGQVAPLVQDLLAVLDADLEGGPDPVLWAALLANLPTDAQRSQTLDQLAAAAPNTPLVMVLKANAALRADDQAAAADAFGMLMAALPDDPRFALGRLAALTRLGRADEARAELEQWLAAHPDNRPVRHALAQSYLAADDREQAIRHYRAIAAAATGDALARNNLAMLLIDTDPAAALSLAREARALQPAQPDIADTLAQVLMHQGQLPEAVALLEEARQGSENPRIGLHLARALLADGRTGQARALLETLAAQPSAVQAEARALLDAGD